MVCLEVCAEEEKERGIMRCSCILHSLWSVAQGHRNTKAVPEAVTYSMAQR